MTKNEKTKILFIEDDPVLQKNVIEILEEEGYVVKTEVDGESGINTARQWIPDLIICDISIPIKNGYEVLQEISSNKMLKSTPFIFLTAKVEKEDIRKGMQMGADDYIFKPFDINDLLNSIRLRLQKNISAAKTSKNLNNTKVYNMDDKIMIKTGTKMQLLAVKEIKCIRADNPYILLKFADGKNSLQRQTLDEWETKLPQKFFLRIHRSTIINTEFIVKIEKLSKTSYIIRLKDEEEPFVISKRFAPKVRDHFS
ncbi:MAG: response regulator [Bacteroidota bacterium]